MWLLHLEIYYYIMGRERLELESRMNGMQAGCEYAEGFMGYRTHGNIADFKLLS